MTEAGPVQEFSFGGLRFDVSFREVGVTTRVYGRVQGEWQELLRFDDFVNGPHYHAPAAGRPIAFDRGRLGDPMEWYLAQIRDHLGEWLTRAGFAEVIPSVDFDVVADNIDKLDQAMRSCVPESFARVPGVGLQRVGS
jgi:hypothetical protein